MEKEITWADIKQLVANFAASQANFAAGQAEVKAAQLETDLKFKEMVEQSKRVDRKLESLISNWGQLIESLSVV